jgi:hypothetical protein
VPLLQMVCGGMLGKDETAARESGICLADSDVRGAEYGASPLEVSV